MVSAEVVMGIELFSLDILVESAEMAAQRQGLASTATTVSPDYQQKLFIFFGPDSVDWFERRGAAVDHLPFTC